MIGSVVVTGGASGIGRATAELLAARGWAVVVADLAPAELPDVTGIRADVTVAADCARAVARAVELAPLRGLVCCAGVEVPGDVVCTTENDWARVVGVNLTGVYLAARAAVPAMVGTGGGSIVVVSSVQGLATQRSAAAYAAAKGGALALTRAMALDHAEAGIRVNAIAPGSVDTPMMRANAAHLAPDDPDIQLRAWGRMHALGRIGEPPEIAAVIAFLLSAEASFVTGATWLVDGGMLAAYG